MSPLSLTTSLCESDSEHFASLYDTVSLGCPSEVFDPTLSSLNPQEEKSSRQVEEEQEESGNTSWVSANLSLSQSRKGNHFDLSESMPQETTVPSNQLKSRMFVAESFADFKEDCLEPNGDQSPVQIVDGGEQCMGSLPSSDSFADFCSAPIEGDEEGCWAEFRNQRHQAEGNTWTQFGEEGSTTQTEGDAEVKQDRRRGDEASNGDSCQDSVPRRIQRLLHTSFPEVLVASGGQHEEEVLSLSNLLQAQNHHPEDGRQERPHQCPEMHGVQWGMWWQRMDIHNAVGLKFQWGDSHTNKILLMCLGMDTRNIVFTGKRKQPVVVPAFASSLGMLEPTKESMPAVCHPGCTAVTTQGSPAPRGILDPLADSVQEMPSSSQSHWISSGLCNSQDGTSSHPASPFGGWN
ncbi:aftiphilin-like [Lampris incognitus]|uniref:aftiphilin-like n=1 Tax=Lampris incognitus TaxID=2546036 RepID=UPI0024B58175|nr:aftiphilin-like [Lampris incognitus]